MIEERVFNNRYRLDRKLGEGGMATVYCGTDIVLRRRVAIKVLREQYASDREFVRRFYQEAESAARLSHPNIVNTYDVGHENGSYFIVMELVDGPSLAEILAADGRLPEPVAIDYAVQIASGLAYAHRMGLLHRDIKPANVLVTKDDVVKLSDFGIARAVSQHTMTLTKPGLVMGSVYYISPEQAQGHDLHETSDLYSVGVVLYQMLAGKLPYTGESPVTVALKHIGDPVPRIDSKEIASPALAAIVNKLLQKQPENRFQSASDLATALREARERPSVAAFHLQDDAPGHPGATRATRSASLPPRRSPMPDRSYAATEVEDRRPRGAGIAVVALIVVLLVATGAGYYLFGRPLPAFDTSIPVGDYTNMTDAEAQQAVVNAGLRTRFVRSASDTVAQNHVIRQFPEPGTRVAKNAVIELVVSNGKALLGLADVRGYLALDAQRTLQQDGFAVTLTRRFDNTAKDNVIDEVPKPGTRVRQGSRVILVISNGPAPVLVPNFVGMSVESAQAEAQKLGITLDTSRQAAIPGYPADAIASQDISAGAKVDKNAIVHAIVSSGMQPAETTGQGPAAAASAAVPAVVGKSYQDAIAAFDGTGLTLKISYSTQSASNGYVIAEDPQPGTQLAQGSAVTLTVSVPGEVPDTEGMSVTTATSTLASAGYGIAKTQYTTSAGAGGRVIGTDPSAGTNLAPGAAVTLIVNGTAPQSPQ